jgi:hypothetical protein
MGIMVKTKQHFGQKKLNCIVNIVGKSKAVPLHAMDAHGGEEV